MVEVAKKDFKIILKLLYLQKDIFKEVGEDKKNNFVKRKTALEGSKLAEKLITKLENAENGSK
jgi:hypothetical protein